MFYYADKLLKYTLKYHRLGGL